MRIIDFYRKEGKTVYIDIDLLHYREVFNEWDFSPISKRSLHEELFEYLQVCIQEIPENYEAKIVLHLPENQKSTAQEQVIITSFNNYFEYEIRKETIKKKSLLKSMVKNFLIGVVLILVSTILGRYIESLIMDFLYNGLLIGGWVYCWEFLYAVLYDLKKFTDLLKDLNRLKKSEIQFAYK